MLSIIVNDKSGDGPDRAARFTALRATLEAAGLEARLAAPRRGESLGALAIRQLDEGASALVVAGGDGTVAAVASACHAASAPMGVIPQGTFNYFARAHGIPQDTEAAVAVLRDGRTRAVAIATVNDEIFLNNTSIGLYPAILDLREDIYRRYGRSRAAAYWSVLRALIGLPRSLRLRLVLDGEPLRAITPLAFVASCAYQLEEFNLEGADAVRSGQFALLLARPEGRLALVRTAWRMARGRARRDLDFVLHTAREIELKPARRSVLVARDGEKARMQVPLRVRYLDRPLTLIVPKDAAPQPGAGPA